MAKRLVITMQIVDDTKTYSELVKGQVPFEVLTQDTCVAVRSIQQFVAENAISLVVGIPSKAKGE